MLRNKSRIILIVVLLMATGVWAVAAGSLVDQKAVLSGRVTSVIAVGAPVHQGTALVNVQSLTGAAPAARATVDGVVKEVLVNVGGQVKSGDVVARIQAQ